MFTGGETKVMPSLSIDVLFFAKSREITGVKQAKIELPIRTSSNDILQHILVKYPGLEVIRDNIILTLNENYLEGNENIDLRPSDEIAVIPPISGG